MTTSGTTAFDLNILSIIEDAYEMVGIESRNGYDLKTARRSLDLLMREWGNRGINFWTIKEVDVPVAAGTNIFTLDTDAIDILDCAWRQYDTTGAIQDRAMTRMSLDEWVSISNKQQVSLPSRFYVERIVPPRVTLWPVPTSDGTFVYWKMRSIQDTGAYTNSMDIPPRFLPAMTAGLAYYLAIKTAAAAQRVPFLQQEYERQFGHAANEDRERASLWLVPEINHI